MQCAKAIVLSDMVRFIKVVRLSTKQFRIVYYGEISARFFLKTPNTIEDIRFQIIILREESR